MEIFHLVFVAAISLMGVGGFILFAYVCYTYFRDIYTWYWERHCSWCGGRLLKEGYIGEGTDRFCSALCASSLHFVGRFRLRS